MEGFKPFDVRLGDTEGAHVRIDVVGYQHPDVAEPQGFDLLVCRVRAVTAPVRATFDYALRVLELLELRAYLALINSGNGPSQTIALAEGLLSLSFAPSRRGPVLCAVLLKSIDPSHLRLEFMITLEPPDITRALDDLAGLP